MPGLPGPLALLIAACFVCHGAGAQTNAVKLVKGTIVEAGSGRPVDGGTILAFIGTSTEPAVRGRINSRTGAFQMILAPATRYRIRVEPLHFAATDFVYETSASQEYEESVQNFRVEPIKIGSTLYSGPLFAAGTEQIRITPKVTSAIEFLKANRAVIVEVAVAGAASAPARGARKPKTTQGAGSTGAGQTGTEPAATAASGLVERRKAAVRELLSGQGIDPERIVFTETAGTRGKGARPDITIVLRGFVRPD